TAWYHPAGGGANPKAHCSGSDSGAGSIDCSYVLVSTPGANQVKFTFSGPASTPTVTVVEVAYTSGPIQAELAMEEDDSSNSSTLSGSALWLGGANDIIFQAINATHAATSINGGFTLSPDSGLAYLENTRTGNAPTWTVQTGSTGVVFGMGFAEYIP